MLEIDDLHVSYGPHEALAGVSLDIDAGEIVVILGANGAGKSSLLQAIAGISEGKCSGRVDLDGQPIERLSADQIVESGVAFVPEGRGIFGDLTVEENLLLGAYSEHARPAQQSNQAHVYELFPKLLDRSKQVSRTMSGGEQQMVAIGRALMSNPKYLLLDEPSLGLSPLLCKELFQSLRKIRDNGISVLMVEQNARQSLAIADRCYLIENGTVTGGGDAAAMLTDPAVQAAYLGGASSATATGTRAAPATAAKPGTAKTYISPGTASVIKPAIPVADYVSRATRQSTSVAVSPPKPESQPSTSKVTVQPVTTPSSHEQQVAELLASFESAATRARLDLSNEQEEKQPQRISSLRSQFIKPANSPVVASQAPSVSVQAPMNRPATPVNTKPSGIKVYRRDNQGQLQPDPVSAAVPAGGSPGGTEKPTSSPLQVFRRGADGKLHPVRS